MLHDKIGFLLLIKLRNENKSKGWPATVNSPVGQNGISENISAIMVEIKFLFSFSLSLSKNLAKRYIPKNAMMWIKTFNIQYAWIGEKT